MRLAGIIFFVTIETIKLSIMTQEFQNPELEKKQTTGDSLLGEGAEKYIRDVANVEDLPGDDEDEDIEEDVEDDDIEEVDLDEDVDDLETDAALDEDTSDEEEDEDYINKDEAKRDLTERGLR